MPQEVKMLTDLFRRIRRMADEIGARRGRPILLAVRTPDSLEFSRALGLGTVVSRMFAREMLENTITSTSSMRMRRPAWAHPLQRAIWEMSVKTSDNERIC